MPTNQCRWCHAARTCEFEEGKARGGCEPEPVRPKRPIGVNVLAGRIVADPTVKPAKWRES